MKKVFLLVFLLCIGYDSWTAENNDDINFAPFYQRKVIDGTTYSRALGPFYESIGEVDQTSLRLEAWRPFYTEIHPNKVGYRQMDFLWPLGTTRIRPDQRQDRYLLWGHTRTYKPKEVNEEVKLQMTPFYESWWLTPIFYHSKGKETAGSTWLFPFYGDINDYFAYDDIEFTLFPLNIRSQKKDVKSESWMWPIYNRAKGKTLDSMRVFPFYGYSEKKDEFINHFYGWPFVHTRQSLNSQRPGKGYFVFPFWGEMHSKSLKLNMEEKSTTCLWPLFTNYSATYHDTPEKNRSNLQIWPFYQQSRQMQGPKSNKSYYWPLYGEKSRLNYNYKFMAWPIAHHVVVKSPATKTETELNFVLPIYSNFTKYRINEKKKRIEESSETRVWPLYKYQTQKNKTTFHLLALMPLHLDEVERNYAPYWTLFSYQKEGKKSRNELLWGMWQYEESQKLDHVSLFPIFEFDVTGKKSSFNLIKGLVGTSKEGDKRNYQLLWFIHF